MPSGITLPATCFSTAENLIMAAVAAEGNSGPVQHAVLVQRQAVVCLLKQSQLHKEGAINLAYAHINAAPTMHR
jgi:hypothetical protein